MPGGHLDTQKPDTFLPACFGKTTHLIEMGIQDRQMARVFVLWIHPPLVITKGNIRVLSSRLCRRELERPPYQLLTAR